MEGDKYTKAGTDIEEVKRLNAASGLSYNEVKALLAEKYKEQIVEANPFEHDSIQINSNTRK